ncbi:Protein of unknown function [Georgenia satyanarayanai]|uniref:DUF3093 domain-containing protein n=1 Tax=Georgenia satyanarayanai TaxID=860221 RepID=A0A2Y8ZWZ9_9MICO|nr:DUF3093 domain-containing protein [Georgenia satyanarayanai]PYG02039.1 Protein of unknown function (DUF3093) [Georgenia satyanarayanai]SSA36850.1 Protein of unknown function [Georgenia satyanarayanai]
MDSVIFSERLYPRPVNVVLGALAGVAVGALVWPFSATAGYVVGAVAVIAVVVVLLVTSPRVVVDLGDEELGTGPVLHAANARIGAEHLGRTEVLDAEAMVAAMGPQADARAFLCQRPWVRRGVRVEVVDPRDPAPYWLVASRRPTELAAALGRAGQAAHSEQTSWPPSS